MMDEKTRERYARQLSVDGFGERAQKILARSTVFLAGAGGLGSSTAFYLAAAGIGNLRIADHGTVELGNLNRQILYSESDLGMQKSRAAAERIGNLNRDVKVERLAVHIDEKNCPALVSGCDVIVDALDNMAARRALNRAAIILGIPIVHGAVSQFYGQLMTVIPGVTPCLICLYRGKAPPETVPVLGAVPGVVGSLQALETIKLLTGIGANRKGSLLVFDGLETAFTEITIPRDPDCPHCGRS